jgi:hypothetical protein
MRPTQRSREAGRGVQKVQEVIQELLREGAIGWTGRQGVRRRVLVLMDHDDAEAAVAREIRPGPPAPYSAPAQVLR